MNARHKPDEQDPVPASPEAATPSAAGEAAGPAAAPAEAEAMKATIASLEDKLRRQQADFLNDVRRLQKQADERVRFAVQPVVSDLLGVADALHGAIEGLKDTEHERRVAAGLRLIERELLEALGRHGVARIDALHKPFDPALHDAVMEVEGDAPERTVAQVTRPGFTLYGRVIRPASVIVSRPPSKPSSPPPTPPAFPQEE